MLQRSPLFVTSLLYFASLASAGPITYGVIVNTSSISGVAGSLDFNFNPGPLVTQPASLQILNFKSDGTLAGDCPCGAGDVSGQLPAIVTFDNSTGFNDYFEDFTFGTTISLEVSFYGLAVAMPDGASTSGSAFAFSMFSDTAGTIPALTSDAADGFAFMVSVGLDGTATVTNFSSETDVGSAISGVPEPGGLAPVGAAVALLGALRFRRRGIGGSQLMRRAIATERRDNHGLRIQHIEPPRRISAGSRSPVSPR